MPVLLALHGIGTQVGDETEALWTVGHPHLNGDLAHPSHVAPQLFLGHVPPGNDEEHHWHPPQSIAKDHDLFVLVEDLGGLLAGDDLAEGAVVDHGRVSGRGGDGLTALGNRGHSFENGVVPHLRCFDKLSMPLGIAFATGSLFPRPEPVEGASSAFSFVGAGVAAGMDDSREAPTFRQRGTKRTAGWRLAGLPAGEAGREALG